MATLNSRITALEQQGQRMADVTTWTDNEILDYLGLPDNTTDEQLQAIINVGVHNGT